MSREKDIEQLVEEQEPSSFRLIITLGIAGFLAGGVLVSVYLVTRPIIASNKAAALEEAIYEVLPGATTYETLVLKEGQLQPPGSMSEQDLEEADKVYLGRNERDAVVGFAITGEEPGFQDIIGAIFGYDPSDEIIIGMEILESKETPGLGDKIFKDEAFQRNFDSLAVEPRIVPVKGESKNKANQVTTITGATISSKAVVALLNEEIAKWKKVVDEYVASTEIKLNE